MALESPLGSSEALAALGKKLALHIAAAAPEALTIADVLPEKLDRLVAFVAPGLRCLCDLSTVTVPSFTFFNTHC